MKTRVEDQLLLFLRQRKEFPVHHVFLHLLTASVNIILRPLTVFEKSPNQKIRNLTVSGSHMCGDMKNI